MNDMRKLMEAVAPLFESHPFKDQLYDRYGDLEGDYGNHPEVRKYLAQANELFKQGDLGGAMEAVKQGERVAAGVSETISAGSIAEGNSDAEYELEEILEQLSELSERAKSIAQQYYPNLFQTYDAYGAFDFGMSSNSYDTTFAKFVGEVLEGDGEEDDDQGY